MVGVIVKVTAATALVGFLGYCVYFDRKRRSDPNFRKKVAQKRKEKEIAARKASAPILPNLNDPRALHRFFLEQVQLGETLLASGHIEEAVQRFAYAVVVCGQPSQLLQVLQQSLSPNVFSMLVAALPEVRRIVMMASNIPEKIQIEEELE